MAENKIFAHTPEEVEALINKEGIEYVSVRFTDLIGVQQHFTVPASEFIDNASPTACRSLVRPCRVSRPSTSPTRS